MKDAHHEEEGDIQLQLQKLLVTFRWCYAPLVFLFGMMAKEDVVVVDTTLLLITALVLALLANVLFALLLRKGASTWLAIGQIKLDLLFFFVIIFATGGGIHSVGHLFFLIPIIASLFFFKMRGGIFVAICSGVLVAFSVALTFPSTLFPSEILITLGPKNIYHLMTTAFVLTLPATGVMFFSYLFTAFLGGSLLYLTRKRDVRLLEQITEVVHQLRTPLSAVKWTLKILLDEDAGKNNKEQKELLLKGFASNERMVTLVNDVLAVSRLESGKFKYHFVPVQFEDLVKEVIKNLLPIAVPRDIHIEFIAPKPPLPKWTMDLDHMRDVLQNLLDNAIKYTKEGGVITVSIAKEGGNLHFSVKDNGIGIPDEARGKLFSRFYRAPNAIYTETNGSGLGLFIAQSIVRRHGGKIWFESTLEKGTTFHVTLPQNGV